MARKTALTQPMVPGIFNVSPINPSAPENVFYYTTQPSQAKPSTTPGAEAEPAAPKPQENSTFLLTLSPHQVAVVENEAQISKGSDIMYGKIDAAIKSLMKSIQEKCETIQGNIDKIIRDEIEKDVVNA